jgi:hypothetical protein
MTILKALGKVFEQYISVCCLSKVDVFTILIELTSSKIYGKTKISPAALTTARILPHLLLTSMLIMTKTCEDIPFTNTWWAMKGDTDLASLNLLESSTDSWLSPSSSRAITALTSSSVLPSISMFIISMDSFNHKKLK